MALEYDPDLYQLATSIEIPATIIRCGCGATELDLNHQLESGQWIHKCLNPKSIETIILAEWHKEEEGGGHTGDRTDYNR